MKLIALFAVLASSCFANVSHPEVLDLRAKYHHSMRPAQEYSEEAFVWFSGLHHPYLNAVYYLSSERDVDSLLEMAPVEAPLSFWIPPQTEGVIDLLKERGFHLSIHAPAMIWQTAAVPLPELEVRSADMRIYKEIFLGVSRFSDEISEAYVDLLEKSRTENFVVYLAGKPVGIGSLFIDGKFGHICNIATLPQYQRKGAGKAIMQHMMNRAFSLGLKQLSLQSSNAGTHLYESLGFQKIFDVDVYVRD